MVEWKIKKENMQYNSVLKINYTNEVTYKTERLRDLENEFIVAGGGREKIDRDFEKVMYILLYLKWITDKDLLCSTWNSAQCNVPAWMEWALGENGYTYMQC